MAHQGRGLPREAGRGGSLSGETRSFREEVLQELRGAFAQARDRLASAAGGALLTADLDCRSAHSARSDFGYERLLGAPDSFTKGEELLKLLRARGRSAFTITNPGDATACRELTAKGRDVLPAAAFRCRLAPFPGRARVLVYGLDAADELRLGQLAEDLDAFLLHARARDLVAVLSRPFEVPEGEAAPPSAWFEHLAMRFDTIEVMHGQADLFQCLLAVRWVQSLTPARLGEIAARLGVDPGRFVRRPLERSMTGGSGDRAGLLAGTV
ncbi:MAG: hypothetical protein J0L75_15465, partial [Spirochaetes bacterium]|nr:hypothetical protein [Spirochaetota bacterium]